MRTVLMVAEKPSLALSLAKIIGKSGVNSRKGFNGACSIHEFVARFPPTGEQARFKFTSVCGHVMTLDFIGKYNSWDKVDPIELFGAPTVKKEASPNLKMPQFLQKEAVGCDFLVLWLDCDKEGENICFEVIDCVSSVMKTFNHGSVFRAKFSAITDGEIMKAFNNLGSPNRNEALSVDARQEFDLRVGCAFTRFQTKFFQGKYGDLDSTLISFGPCQTPTLGFCVERHDIIQSFKPEPYWVIAAKVYVGENKLMMLECERGRIFDKEVAQVLLAQLKKVGNARLYKIEKTKKSKAKPLALNTVEMLKAASSGLGMGPHHAMQLAEKLYVQGYISYPRTETTSYPNSFDLIGTLRDQQNNPVWGQEVRSLLREGISHPRKGHDVGDHPPITPMRSATEAELGHDMWRLYDYITRHFIGTLSKDCIYLLTTFHFWIDNEQFTSSGKTLVDRGFTDIMPWQSIDEDEMMPSGSREGDICNINEVVMTEKHTSPPDYLTESELISLMEKHGIGTDASIPVHINNISERNYVNITQGRRLKPTNLGIVLVHGYQKIDPDLVKPTMRAAVEEQFNLIAQGMAVFQDVLRHGIDIFAKKYKYFIEHISCMDQLFEVSFTSLAASGKPLSRCGKCRRYMKFIQAKPSRLHCASCDDTLNVPQNSNIRTYKELKCPLDDYELLYCSMGSKGFVFCPYCYNDPPFGDTNKGMGCNECLHPSCPQSLTKTKIADCQECEQGVLAIDPNSMPKWKVLCTKCTTMVNVFENAHKVAVLGKKCEGCESSFVEVSYKEKTPFQDGKTSHQGCIFCDAQLAPLTQFGIAKSFNPHHRSRGGGGRGRGRGRARGRGRGGRGRGAPKDKMAQLAAYFV